MTTPQQSFPISRLIGTNPILEERPRDYAFNESH
jgi:hypothetical protein